MYRDNHFFLLYQLQDYVLQQIKRQRQKISYESRTEGEAEAKYVSGGIARQLQAILYGLRDSVLGFSGNVAGTSAKDVVDMVLLTWYF